MDSGVRRACQLQKSADVTKSNFRKLSPPSTLFGNCFPMKTVSVVSDSDEKYSEDPTSYPQQTEVNVFCDALKALKEAFTFSAASEAGGGMVTEKLREMNSLLRQSLTRHQSLYAKDILEMATLVNSKIKAYYASADAELKTKLANVILYAIQNLSIAFQKSLSDNSSAGSLFDKMESFENLNLEPVFPRESTSSDTGGGGGAGGGDSDVDQALLNVDSGIDKAIQHAVSWLDSAKFFLNYVEKRTALDADFAKYLSKLSSSSHQSIRNEKMIPLHSAFTAAFAQDADFAENIQSSCLLMQTERVVQPLNARCLEHKKVCRDLREMWTREERMMREAAENLRKSKAAYNARCRDSMKTKESTQRAIAESAMAGGDGALAIRVEKRRKLEDDAVVKAMAAQVQYESCIDIANNTRTQMNATKKKILCQVRQLIDASDQFLKMVTTDYFSLMSARMAPIPVQFQTLKKLSERYEPGSVYAQYIEQLRSNSSTGSTLEQEEPFVFQVYSPTPEDQDRQFAYMKRLQEFRKRISPSNEILPAELAQNLVTKRSVVKKRSLQDDYAISRSLDSSPVRNRRSYSQTHRKLTNRSSFDALTDLSDDKDYVKDFDREFDDIQIVRGLAMSKVAQMHDFKRLRTFSRCRQCDCYIYFNGFECSLCGLSCHKICLRNLRWECGHSKRRSSCRRSFSDQPFPPKEKGLPDRVPYVVKKCIEEIDRSGLEVKGIFRVSAVKSKVESLCQKLESEDEALDLSNESPHTVASLLRLYLRQLNDPLVPFEVCQELVELVKTVDQVEKSDLIQRMKTVLNRLPGQNFWTCSCLLHHLKRVSDFSEHNQMSPSNLAVVFGPTLLRTSNEAVSVNSLIDNHHQCRVVELLISNAQDIFGPDPIALGEQNLDVGSGTLARNKTGRVSEDSDVSFDQEEHRRPNTTWFDLSPDVAQKNLNCQTADLDKDCDEPMKKTSYAEDEQPDQGMATADSCSSSVSDASLVLLSPDAGSEAVGKAEEPPGSSSFHRTRAYSPQFHRRITAAAPVRRETFHVKKTRSSDHRPVVAKSASNDEM